MSKINQTHQHYTVHGSPGLYAAFHSIFPVGFSIIRSILFVLSFKFSITKKQHFLLPPAKIRRYLKQRYAGHKAHKIEIWSNGYEIKSFKKRMVTVGANHLFHKFNLQTKRPSSLKDLLN